MKLLEDLEALNLLRVVKRKASANKKLSDKYAGKLPADIGDDLQKYIEQSRNEWSSNI